MANEDVLSRPVVERKGLGWGSLFTYCLYLLYAYAEIMKHQLIETNNFPSRFRIDAELCLQLATLGIG